MKKNPPVNGNRALVRMAEKPHRVAPEADHLPGVLDVYTESSVQPAADLVERQDGRFFVRPGPVVTTITALALLFILAIAWIIAHEPPP